MVPKYNIWSVYTINTEAVTVEAESLEEALDLYNEEHDAGCDLCWYCSVNYEVEDKLKTIVELEDGTVKEFE